MNVVDVIIDHQVIGPLESPRMDAVVMVYHISLFLRNHAVLECQLCLRVLLCQVVCQTHFLKHFLLHAFVLEKVQAVNILELENLLGFLRNVCLAMAEDVVIESERHWKFDLVKHVV